MKQLIASLLVAAVGSTLAPAASAVVLTFDDIGIDTNVPSNYGGLDWSGSDWFVYGEAQAPFNPHSGDFRATSGFADADDATAFRAATPVTFQGAWFAGLQGATVMFELYLGDALVATSATLDPGATPAFLASGYDGLVDKIVVASPGQGSYVMDDVTFTAAVPEPQTYPLVLAGLGFMSLVARRRMRRDDR